MKLKTKDFLSFAEIDAGETLRLIELAIRLKRDLKAGRAKTPLQGKTLVMIFQKPSTRTRVSFETGMYQLGGHTVNLAHSDMQLARGESLQDTAMTLSRYCNAIMARVFEHSDVESLADSASIPVINGLSNSFHPCQTLADLMTIQEKKKKLRGLQLAWIGDGNNVCNSTILGCARTGINITVATPRGFEPDSSVLKESAKSVKVELVSDPSRAVRDADIVMTDTFASIHDKSKTRAGKFLPKFRVSERLFSEASDDAIFMHCLPAKRGEEVASSVIDGPRSAVWDQAENRLHSQKALLSSLGI